MKVAVYHNNRDIRIEERATPAIGDDEALLRVEASGICGSDVMEWYRVKKAPLVLGHEVAGTIVEVGRDVATVKVGDRVVASHHVPCNTCHHCLTGHDTVCETLRSTSFDPGGFSQFVRLPAINVDRGLYAIAENVSFAQASFAEPLACVLRAQRIASMSQGHSVLVLGAGLAGLMHVACAPCSGAGFVAATDIDDARLIAASTMGASQTWQATGDIPARLREENGGRLADLTILATAAPSAIEQAFACTESGGTLLIFALPDPGTIHPVDMHQLWKSGIRIISSYAGNRTDHVAALTLIGSGRIDVDALITHRLPLSETAEGFRLVERASDALKVIIEPHRT